MRLRTLHVSHLDSPEEPLFHPPSSSGRRTYPYKRTFLVSVSLVLFYFMFWSERGNDNILAAVITSSSQNIRAVEVTWKTFLVPELTIEYVAAGDFHPVEYGPAHPFLPTMIPMAENIKPTSIAEFPVHGDVMKAWLWLYSKRQANAKWFMIMWDRSYWLPGKLVTIMSHVDSKRYPVVRIIGAQGQPSQWVISKNFLSEFSYRIPQCSKLVAQGWNQDDALSSCIFGWLN